MHALADAATDPDRGRALVAAIAVAGVLAWLGAYALGCWLWPFAACRRCSGAGKRRSPSGKAFRLCPRCKGTGRRLRTGRRVYNLVRSRRDAAR